MRHNKISLSIWVVSLLLAGCQVGTPDESSWPGEGATGAAKDGSGSEPSGLDEKSCTHSGSPGSSSYCSAECPCDADLGDCDSDAECAPGLRCASNIGAEYGWDPGVDVCVPLCSPLGKSVSSMCSAECPCDHGVGDCDGDAECAPGLTCLLDAGASYGYDDPTVDVCVAGCPSQGSGAWNFCTPECPCDAGQGDCDSDTDCAAGIQCVHDVGVYYGFDAEVDICGGTVPVCGNGVIEAGEQCDDGNGNNDDGCTVGCTTPVCGDGFVQASLGEVCDDGNAVNGDGCESSCAVSACTSAGPAWTHRHGTTGDEWGRVRIAAHGCGDIAMAVELVSTLDLGAGPHSTRGSADIFLARLDREGNARWSRSFGTSAYESPTSLTLDTAGNMAITGHLGLVDFGAGAPATPHLVAVFDGAGNHKWSKAVAGARGTSVAFDTAGNVVVAGTCDGTVDFGGELLSCTGTRHLFIVKLDAAGAPLWSRSYEGPSFDDSTPPPNKGIFSMAVDGAGNIFVGGSFDSLDLGGGYVVTSGYSGGFVASVDRQGNHRWTRAVARGEKQRVEDIALDGAGNVVVTGSFNSTSDFFGTGALSAAGDDTAVLKFDAAGAHLWTRHFTDAGTSSSQNGTAIAVAPGGNIFITGWFGGSVDFGGGVLSTTYGWDTFVVALSASGAHVHSHVAVAPEFQHGMDVAADRSGQLIATGQFKGTIDMGPGAVTSAGSYDIYLARIAP